MTTTQIKELHAVDCNKGGELASLHVFDLGVFSIEHEQNNVVVLCFYVRVQIAMKPV